MYKAVRNYSNNNNNNIFISYIKYTSITPPANSKANRGRWCEDGLRLITIVEVKKKCHIYNKEGQSNFTQVLNGINMLKCYVEGCIDQVWLKDV